MLLKVDRKHWGKIHGKKKIRKLMIGTIAGAVERMAADQKNCYNTGIGGRHCNIGDFVSVTLEKDLYFIDVRFHGRATGGRFDCVAIIEATDNYVKTLREEYLNAMGLSGSWVIQNTHCLGTDVTK
jgi:hypothetical protein